MHTNGAKNKRDASRCNGFCFNSQDFQEMFSKCCKRQIDDLGCLIMMQNVMDGTCCEPKTKKPNKK